MKFEIVYWLGSILTVFYVKADNYSDAVKKFEEVKGKKEILRIKEVTQDEYCC